MKVLIFWGEGRVFFLGPKPIDFVHVFDTLFQSLSNLQSSSNLHPAQTLAQNIFKSYDVMMTSSRDLLWNFEYLIIPLDFVHVFEALF